MATLFETEDLYDTIVLGGVRSPGSVKISGHDRKINWDVKDGQGQIGASATLKNVPLIVFTCTFYLADDDDFEAWKSFQALIDSTVTPKKGKSPGKDPAVVQTRKALEQARLDARRVASNQPVSFDTASKDATIKIAQDRIGSAELAFDQASKNALRAASVKVMSALDIYHPDLASQNPPITSVVKDTVGGAIHDGKGGRTYVVKFQEYKPPQAYSGSPIGSASKPADPNQAALDELDRLTKQYAVTPWG